MKNSIYISGITCAILMLVGCIDKIMHWPGANALLIVSVVLFCFVFLPFALINSYKTEGQSKFKALYLVTFVVFSICMMGVLFKVLHWPGASALMMAGLLLPFVLFLPVYLYQSKNDKKYKTVNFLGIMFGLVFLSVFNVILALNISKQVLVGAAISTYNSDKAMSFSKCQPSDTAIDGHVKQSADELCAYIEELKCELLTATGNDVCDHATLKSDYNVFLLNNKENKEIPMKVLLGNGETNKLTELKKKVDAYAQALSTSGNMNPLLSELSRTLFNVSSVQVLNDSGEEVTMSWEEREFENYQLVFVLDILSRIESNAKLIQSELVTEK